MKATIFENFGSSAELKQAKVPTPQPGATHPIDYTKESLTQAAQSIAPEGFDVIFDAVGGESLKEAVSLASSTWRIVSIQTIARSISSQPKVNGIFAIATLALQSVIKWETTRPIAFSAVPSAVISAKKSCDLILVPTDNLVVSAMPLVLKKAKEIHLPVMASDPGSVALGAMGGRVVDYTQCGVEGVLYSIFIPFCLFNSLFF